MCPFCALTLFADRRARPGTLIDSSPAVVCAWELMKETYPFLDLDHILKSAHGYRTVDALRKWCQITDEKLLAREVMRFEKAILEAAERKGKEAKAADPDAQGGIVVLPGVKQLLTDIEGDASQHDGQQGWAVCTSSTHFYASRALPTAGLPTPNEFITAESVRRGKPHPDPYELGAKQTKSSPLECVVVEDAPTGIRAGKAAGSLVLATCTSHTRESLEKENPDFLVEDLSHVRANRNPDGSVSLVIDQPEGRPVSGKHSAPATPLDTPLGTPVMSRATSPEPGVDPAAKRMARKSLAQASTPTTDNHGAIPLKAQGGF